METETIMETTINEYYVSLEVAKLLKEAGFDMEGMSYYQNGIFYHYSINRGRIINMNQNSAPNYMEQYSAPTLEVAQRWLREVKNLIILIDITPSYCNEKPMGYKFVIHVSCGKHIYGEWKDTYEEAQQAGIKKALELILEKGE